MQEVNWQAAFLSLAQASPDAIAICTRAAQVVYINDRMQMLMQAGQWLRRSDDDRLTMVDAAHNRALTEALTDCARATDHQAVIFLSPEAEAGHSANQAAGHGTNHGTSPGGAAEHRGYRVQVQAIQPLASALLPAVPMQFLVSLRSLSDRSPFPAESLRTHFALTKTEVRVAQHLYDNVTEADIAATLSMALNTVKAHRKRIYAKLAVTSRVDLVNLIKAY